MGTLSTIVDAFPNNNESTLVNCNSTPFSYGHENNQWTAIRTPFLHPYTAALIRQPFDTVSNEYAAQAFEPENQLLIGVYVNGVPHTEAEFNNYTWILNVEILEQLNDETGFAAFLGPPQYGVRFDASNNCVMDNWTHPAFRAQPKQQQPQPSGLPAVRSRSGGWQIL